MIPRFVTALAVFLLLVGTALPLSAQEEEQDGNGEDSEQGSDNGDAGDPPSVTMVHYGPGSGGGSLDSLYPDQVRELGEGDSAFTGLLKRETTGERHGGILVVAPSGQSPDQGLAGAIRTQLPKAGWLTLSMAQPREPVAKLPERVFEPRGSDGNRDEEDGGADEDGQGDDAEASDSPDMTIEVAESSETPERREEWQERATDRLETAVDALRDEGAGVTVLVGIGDGADLILRYAQANGTAFSPDQFGVVLVEPRLRPPFSDELGRELGENYPVPVLDLYDRGMDRNRRAETRSAEARRAGFDAYTQSAIPIPRGGAAREQRRVPARIRGWLSGNLKPGGDE